MGNSIFPLDIGMAARVEVAALIRCERVPHQHETGLKTGSGYEFQYY
jgi:hypothetical protein